MQVAEAPPARPEPVQVAEVPPAPPEPAVAEAAPAPAKVTKPVAKKKVAKRRKIQRRKIHSAGVEKARLDAVRAEQERKAAQAPRPVSRPWPRMPSPGPAGQVIQLGAFTTPARANAAYYQRIARYKSLARMPRVVVPVATKPDRPRPLCLAPRHDLAPTFEDGVPQLAAERRPLPGDRLMEGFE